MSWSSVLGRGTLAPPCCSLGTLPRILVLACRMCRHVQGIPLRLGILAHSRYIVLGHYSWTPLCAVSLPFCWRRSYYICGIAHVRLVCPVFQVHCSFFPFLLPVLWLSLRGPVRLTGGGLCAPLVSPSMLLIGVAQAACPCPGPSGLDI